MNKKILLISTIVLALDQIMNVNDILFIIQLPNCDEQVLEKAIERTYTLFGTVSGACGQIYRKVIDSDKCTANILCLIITFCKIGQIIVQAVLSPVADTKVLNEAICKAFLTSSIDCVDILNAVIATGKATPDMLNKIIKDSPASGVILNVVKSPIANEENFENAINRLYTVACTDIAEIFNAIINNNNVTANILCKIIKLTYQSSVILNAINSPVADAFVLNCAVDTTLNKFLNYGIVCYIFRYLV